MIKNIGGVPLTRFNQLPFGAIFLFNGNLYVKVGNSSAQSLEDHGDGIGSTWGSLVEVTRVRIKEVILEYA